MVLLDTTVLAVAEPSIIISLHTGIVGVGRATTAYTMALASALILGGAVADRLGAYPVFIFGVFGFGAASLACALSPNLALLLVFRALLGFCAAAIIPSSLGLIASLYPEPGSRGRAISAWAAISGAALALAAGPLLGGWLIAMHGWREVFVINAPIAGVVHFLCRPRIASSRHVRAISWLPHVGLMGTLAMATLAMTKAGQGAWASGCRTRARRRRAGIGNHPDRPDLGRTSGPWRAPPQPCSVDGLRMGAAVNYALSTVIFSIPLLLHATARQTGVTLLPMTVPVAVNGFGLLLCGLGVSWTLPAVVGFAVNQAVPEAASAVGGILNSTRQIGATVAAAIASATLTQHHGGPSSAIPFLIAAVVCVLGLTSATRQGSTRADGSVRAPRKRSGEPASSYRG